MYIKMIGNEQRMIPTYRLLIWSCQGVELSHGLNHPVTEIQHQDEESNLFTRNFEPNQKVEADEHKHGIDCVERLVGKKLPDAIRDT